MKVIKQRVILFLDEDRSNIPVHMIGEVKLAHDNIICIKLGSFGIRETWRDFFLTYADEAKALSDYRQLLRFKKKQAGLLCKNK